MRMILVVEKEDFDIVPYKLIVDIPVVLLLFLLFVQLVVEVLDDD
jgi:hypothetical protein